LALNASIEAARAGAGSGGGQGFAVVAEEIRELAEKSQNSVDNIQGIINSLSRKTDQAVDIIEENNTEIERGAETLADTAGVFENIVERVEQVTDKVQKVAQFSDQLLAESKQISQETEDQSAAIEEIAGASQELTAMAGQLEELVAEFKVK
jgi:methyl-accepting chemotaxis protein